MEASPSSLFLDKSILSESKLAKEAGRRPESWFLESIIAGPGFWKDPNEAGIEPFTKRAWYGAGEVVKGNVDIVEVLELREKIGYWAREIVVGEIKVLEFGEFGDCGLDWAHEFGEFVEDEGLEVREVTHRGRYLGREIGVWKRG
ncbi:hypothetical protein GmHk_15G044414 [Glycine max]|nr:hypothetical protein GmHk_15G044414 [Glycine max]